MLECIVYVGLLLLGRSLLFEVLRLCMGGSLFAGDHLAGGCVEGRILFFCRDFGGGDFVCGDIVSTSG